MTTTTGRLFVVATPIGNLEDMSPRAVRTLSEASLIAAEDTRHSARLLHHLGIATPMVSLHQHNEHTQSRELLQRLISGERIALISDAGTPLISDPGFDLVRAAREAGIPVVAVPGPSALVTALSIAAMPCDRFMFEGFLPAKLVARQKVLEGLRHEVRTVVFYESSHRIAETLADLATVLGLDRRIGIARELTKLHEEVWTGPAGAALRWLEEIPERRQGEFVVMIAGAQNDEEAQHVSIDVERLLRTLSQELPLSRAAQVVADLTGIKRNRLYDRALELRGERN